MSAGPDKVIRDEVRAMSAYFVPTPAGMVKLDAMENPYGLPEPLRREIAEALAGAELNRYPDPSAPALVARLRSAMAVPRECALLLGNGSDEIIHIMIEACARPGAVIMAPSPTFVMYSVYAKLCGLRYASVPLNADFALDADRLLAAMAEHRPAIVFLAYPNPPAGNLFPDADVERLIAAAPGLVVLDEAYQPFARRSFMDRLAGFPNVVLLRTLSKLGLAGIRLGYLVGPPQWIREFDKVRSPYNVNVLTQIVAEKALEHREVLDAQADAICAERVRLTERLRALPGVLPYPSDANFVLARMPRALDVFEELKRRRVLVRCFPEHPLVKDCLRLTVGTPAENDRLLDALRTTLAEFV
ncbi:MAG TPA: histidinol-phosphate transaminase [Burkholderiales bacterium]